MKRLMLAFAVFFTAGIMYSAPAAAQASRTWISGVGDDANPCSRTAPCKTFAGAISKTAAGGMISCLDPGGFGALTITKSITLSCDQPTGSILVAGTNGININGAGINVTISGIEIEGLGNTGAAGLSGIKVFQAGSVRIVNTSIRGFNTGIDVSPATAGGVITVAIDNVLIAGGTLSSGFGVLVSPGNVNASSNVTISNTRVIGQGGTGLAVNTAGGTSAALSVTATGSVFSGNNSGVIAKSLAGTGTVNLSVTNSTMSQNSLQGFQANGPGVTAQLSGNTITGNGTGIGILGTPSVTTFGDNIVRQNGTNGTFPSAPVTKN